MKLTYPEWQRYAEDLKLHELRMQATEPQRDQFQDSVEYHSAKSKWDMAFAMMAPNKPGYYRANDD